MPLRVPLATLLAAGLTLSGCHRFEVDRTEVERPVEIDAGASSDASTRWFADARSLQTPDATPPPTVHPNPSPDPRSGPTGSAQDAGAASALPAVPPWIPVVAAGPMPDCRSPVRGAPAAARATRWLAYRAREAENQPSGVYLVAIGDDGPGSPQRLQDVANDWPVGNWTDSGRHFAHEVTTDPGFARGIQLAQVDDHGAVVPPMIAGHFLGWAPRRESFVMGISSLFKVYDANHLDQPERSTPAPYGGLDSYFWSPDGRFLTLSAADAPAPGLRRLDLDAQPLALEAPFTSAGGYGRWSPDSRFFAFARYINTFQELWITDFVDGVARNRMPNAHLNNVNSALGNHRWLDAEHLLWDDLDHNFHVLTVTASSLTQYDAFTAKGQYAVSPSGACVAYEGPCGDRGQPAVCLRRIEPGSQERRISNWVGWPLWSEGSDQLAILANGGVEVLNFDGAPFAPKLALDGTTVFRRDAVSWAPGTHAPWLAYLVDPLQEPRDLSLALWSPDTQTTVTLSPDGVSPLGHTLRLVGAVWSPDGRDMALLTSDGAFPHVRAPLIVQRITPSGFGPRWEVEGPHLSLGTFADWQVAFQP